MPAQTGPEQTTIAGAGGADSDVPRAVEYYSYNRVAKSGPARGEEFYYFKCWPCHNEFQKVAPQLKGLYQRGKLLSGQPVTDETVKDKIRNGGAIMPAFRYELSDADLADLVGYLRERCCWDTENPPPNPRYHANPTPGVPVSGRNLRGGPWGAVRSVSGENRQAIRKEAEGASESVPLEGIMVQLHGQNSNFTTTVYTNTEGKYEFPQLPSGPYSLRIARALEFQPYQKSVRVNGAAHLEDISLQRATDSEFVPPTRENEAQLSGAELVGNLSGTAQEKRMFSYGCGSGCHTYGQILRNRFDEKGWRAMVTHMTHNTGSLLLQKAVPNRIPPEEQDVVVKWLASVRGPDSKDMGYMPLAGPRGAATRVVVTAYEVPRLMTAPHDPSGDSQGNIWFNSHRTAYVNRLDPRTGIVKEYKIPSTPGANPGQHWITVDKQDLVWFSENWSHKLGQLDPKTGEVRHVKFPSYGRALNSPGLGNLALSADGYIWRARGNHIDKYDTKTGQAIKRYPLQKVESAYGNEISPDGNFCAGGAWPEDFVVFLDVRTGETWELQTRTPRAGPKRGGFDPENNAWFGGTGGLLIKFDRKTHQLQEFRPPTPNISFYEALPDKNGEIWAGEMYAGRFVRFNPRTEQWIEYVLPEPISHNRRTWIDNSTNPVTVWYVDHDGILVRIEPLE
ncbi:MAG: hypothetical protein A3J28_06465 [Acidobacteria bacterium RIFCSPLOWO2_12_FULL_60_22]|nr:MAG: hypothetical protein A3J28_06465 [Acidobacteria bacterium RIFCSPLOWO2_12_FULL_60_22]